jgi:hypothetical protein
MRGLTAALVGLRRFSAHLFRPDRQASIAFPSLSFASALDRGRPCSVGDSATLVRDRRLGVRRVGRVLLDAADEIERGVQRLVVLRIRRDIGLRAGLLVAFGLKVSAQRRLAPPTFKKRAHHEPEEPPPSYPDRYAKVRAEEAAARSARDDGGPTEPPPPVEWFKFTITVRLPHGKNNYGQIDEYLYSIQGDVCLVKSLDGRPIGTLELRDGDDILAAARKVVRDKGKHTAFWDPLPPRPRGMA